jgi:hypothetical protein
MEPQHQMTTEAQRERSAELRHRLIVWAASNSDALRYIQAITAVLNKADALDHYADEVPEIEHAVRAMVGEFRDVLYQQLVGLVVTKEDS